MVNHILPPLFFVVFQSSVVFHRNLCDWLKLCPSISFTLYFSWNYWPDTICMVGFWLRGFRATQVVQIQTPKPTRLWINKILLLLVLNKWRADTRANWFVYFLGQWLHFCLFISLIVLLDLLVYLGMPFPTPQLLRVQFLVLSPRITNENSSLGCWYWQS